MSPTATPMNPRRRLVCAIALGWASGLALLSPGLAAAPDHPRLSRDLRALKLVAGNEGRVDVIVSYSGPLTTQRRSDLEKAGAVHRRSLRMVRAIAARVPVSSLVEIAGDPHVVAISLDDEIVTSTDVAVPTTSSTLARQAYGVDGRGVRVAVLDSGVAPVAGLDATEERPEGRLAAWADLIRPHASGPSDPFGHGTHVAGIIAGSEIEIRDPGERHLYGGVAPGAEIVSVRVLDHRGRGLVSDAIAGLEWVMEHAQELNIRVVNLSIGHPVRDPVLDDPLVRACERAWESGVLVVVSAGNLGREEAYGSITSPGNSPVVLTVGAMTDRGTVWRWDDAVATYSSRGPTRFDGVVKPDLLAPGDHIISLRSPRSLLDRRFPENRVGSTSRGADAAAFFRLSGTSMAAAMVSGMAALLFAEEPGLTPDDVKARLMRSADKGPDGIFTQGAGAADAIRALETAGESIGSSVSARTVRDDLEVRVTEGAPWSDQAGWDLETIYGPAALWDTDAAWEFESIWSVENDEGDQVIWQVPGPGEAQLDRTWQRVPGTAAHSVVWQLVDSPLPGPGTSAGGRDLANESVVWQGRPSKKTELVPESVVWQGRPVTLAGGSLADVLTTESVVWQQTDEAMRVLILGDEAKTP